MDNTHPYNNIPIPHNAPFRLSVSSGKGWGAFATRNICKGNVILQETPLFVIQKPHWMIQERDVLAALLALPENEKAIFCSMRYNATEFFPTTETAFAENSFALPARSGTGKVHGFFPLLSRFNHSCLPNSKLHDQVQPGDRIRLYATCDIGVGDEIYFCYEPYFNCRTRNDRHRILHFKCTCQACGRTSSSQVLSDMRRTLTRGLNYLTTGRDMNGQVHRSKASSIITDDSLKRDAESCNISLSSRFVYTLLTVTLLEQEGLLDSFTEARMAAGIMYMLEVFETENRKMVDQAIL